jgi:hypothetical protein
MKNGSSVWVVVLKSIGVLLLLGVAAVIMFAALLYAACGSSAFH